MLNSNLIIIVSVMPFIIGVFLMLIIPSKTICMVVFIPCFFLTINLITFWALPISDFQNQIAEGKIIYEKWLLQKMNCKQLGNYIISHEGNESIAYTEIKSLQDALWKVNCAK